MNDWEHRLHVLQAWRTWCTSQRAEQAAKIDEVYGSSYRAVLEGCAITVRSLCDVLGVKFNSNGKTVSTGSNRMNELTACIDLKEARIQALGSDQQRLRHLLEVLYHANRPTAHPGDGGLYHEVDHEVMASAINTVLDWLSTTPPPFPELAQVDAKFLKRIG